MAEYFEKVCSNLMLEGRCRMMTAETANRKDIILAFIEQVEKQAEENMLKTGKLEGAHYAAMKKLAAGL
jgi:hypothetical protein